MFGVDGLFWLVLILNVPGQAPHAVVIPQPYASDSACHAAAERWDQRQTSFYTRTHECIHGDARP